MLINRDRNRLNSKIQDYCNRALTFVTNIITFGLGNSFIERTIFILHKEYKHKNKAKPFYLPLFSFA